MLHCIVYRVNLRSRDDDDGDDDDDDGDDDDVVLPTLPSQPSI